MLPAPCSADFALPHMLACPHHPPLRTLNYHRVWTEFSSTARRDGWSPAHWERCSATETADYPFAKFNKRTEVIKYSDDEYAEFIETDEVIAACNVSGSAAPWTREATDLLFDLARQYDLRWPIIHDRWVLRPTRPIEALKQRFYVVTTHIIEARESRKSKISPASLNSLGQFKNFAYNAAAEMERRRQLDKAFRAVPQSLQDEAARRAELAAVDAALTKLKKDAQLASDNGDHGVATEQLRVAAAMTAVNKRAPEHEMEALAPPTLASAAMASAAPVGMSMAGVRLRSEVIAAPLPGFAPKSKTYAKIMQLLKEAGAPSMHDLPASAPVSAAWHKLRMDAFRLILLQKQVVRAERRTHFLTHKWRSLSSQRMSERPARHGIGGAHHGIVAGSHLVGQKRPAAAPLARQSGGR